MIERGRYAETPRDQRLVVQRLSFSLIQGYQEVMDEHHMLLLSKCIILADLCADLHGPPEQDPLL